MRAGFVDDCRNFHHDVGQHVLDQPVIQHVHGQFFVAGIGDDAFDNRNDALMAARPVRADFRRVGERPSFVPVVKIENSLMIHDALRPLDVFAEMAVRRDRQIAERLENPHNQAPIRKAMPLEFRVVPRLIMPIFEQIAQLGQRFEIRRDFAANIGISVFAGRFVRRFQQDREMVQAAGFCGEFLERDAERIRENVRQRGDFMA